MSSSNRTPSWLIWLLLPFAVVIGGVIAMAVLGFFALVMLVLFPWAALKNWHHERLVVRKLRSQNRLLVMQPQNEYVELKDRLLIVVILPKGPCSLWAIPSDSQHAEMLSILPTYAALKADYPGALRTLEAIDSTTKEQLQSLMNNAIRVDCRRSKWDSLPSEFIDNARVVIAYEDYSPSLLIDESLSQSA